MVAVDSYHQMLLAFCAGSGFALIGAVNALLRRSSPILRVAISLSVISGMAGVALAAGERSDAGVVLTLLGSVYVAFLLFGSVRLAGALSAAASVLRNPVVRWSLLGVLGLAGAIAFIVISDDEYFRDVDRQMAELEAASEAPPSEVPAAHAVTDFGRDVAIREVVAPRDDAMLRSIEDAIFSRPDLRDQVIRSQSSSDRTNCHGWVFTGGRYWVTGGEVDRILNENGYQPVTDPRPGDLVVYRNGANVAHSALVRYVSPGLPVMVEGKWGCSGVYLHPVDKSIYGTDHRYYRSSRSGHILVGLDSGGASHAQGTPHVVPDPANPDEFTE